MQGGLEVGYVLGMLVGSVMVGCAVRDGDVIVVVLWGVLNGLWAWFVMMLCVGESPGGV